MLTFNIQPAQSPKMRQFASSGFARSLLTGPNLEVVQRLNNIRSPDVNILWQKLKRCHRWIEKMAPNLFAANAQNSDLYYTFSDGLDSKTENEVINVRFKEMHATKMLDKEHWKLKSEVSAQTFFENNYALKSFDVPPFNLNTRGLNFLTTVSPQLMFARGFKTQRSEPEYKNVFEKNQDATFGGITELKMGGEKNSYGAGYVDGLADGKAQGNNSKSTNENDASSKKTSWEKFWNATWSATNKVSFILWLVIGLLIINQFTGFRFGINRGANEIMPEDIDVTFDDVKGCDEAKQELQEIVDFLMNPEKFSALGGKLPKGCLLEGPPGTGKTLLAKAVAGQAGVPFFQASGSEFDEVLVGQGARRVRDLFKTAKQRAPCVIFIDEMDSVGGKRTSSTLHPYANQTINQLLSEMDGFVSNEGVIVIGATNRKDQLDKALLRPGRFDAQIRVEIPDMKGRKEILELYLCKIKHDHSVSVDKLAKLTVGFTPAELENMVNTSAIRAAVEGKDWVTMADFEYSHDKQTLGTDWKSRVVHKDDLKITAYHEAGHTLVNIFTENTHPLHKVTIVSKGRTGGHTAFVPERDSTHWSKAEMLAQMDTAMGGRAAEEIILGKDKVTGGASSDLEGATNIAKLYVKKLGMSEKFGLRVVGDRQEEIEMSESTKNLMDTEVTRLLNDSYKNATNILKTHRKELDLLADALLKYETLDADDVKAILEGNSKALGTRNTLSSNSKIHYTNNSQVNNLPSGKPEDIAPGNGGVLL